MTKTVTEAGYYRRQEPSRSIRKHSGPPRAWTRASLKAEGETFSYDLKPETQDEIAAALGRVATRGLDLTTVEAEGFQLPSFAADVPTLRRCFDEGFGFVIVRGLDVAAITQDQADIVYWALANYMGRVVHQNLTGARLDAVSNKKGETLGSQLHSLKKCIGSGRGRFKPKPQGLHNVDSRCGSTRRRTKPMLPSFVAGTSSNDLTDAVKDLALELGADIVNAAGVERWEVPAPFDSERVFVYPQSGYRPTELLPSARSFIVVAVRVLDGVADTATTPCATTGVQGNFAYVYLNRMLHDITFGLAKWLENEAGFRSVPLGYNIGSRYNREADEDHRIIGPAYGLFSMKRAAVLAGLGRKSRNGLVSNERLGTRMRLGCVITEAPLGSDPLLEGDACPANCDICYRVCPTMALTVDGRVNHLSCFSDCGRRGKSFEELKSTFKKVHPPDDHDDACVDNDFDSIDGVGNRACRVACVMLCPLGENRMPDVMRRVNSIDSYVDQIQLTGFPAIHDEPPAPDGYPRLMRRTRLATFSSAVNVP